MAYEWNGPRHATRRLAGTDSSLTPAREEAIVALYTGALAGNLTDAQQLYNWAYHRGAQYPHGNEPQGTWQLAMTFWDKLLMADPAIAAQASGTAIPTSPITLPPVPPGQPPVLITAPPLAVTLPPAAPPGQPPTLYQPRALVSTVSTSPAGTTATGVVQEIEDYVSSGISGGSPPSGALSTGPVAVAAGGLSTTDWLMLGAAVAVGAAILL